MRSWAALGAALALLGAPVAALAAGSPATIDLGGVSGYVRSDPGTTLVTLELFVRAGLDRQTPAQNGLAALTAEALLHAPVDGVPLIDAVEARGGSISYSVSGQYVRFALEAQPATVTALAPLVARVLTAPAFDGTMLTAARGALGERIADADSDPRLVGLQMLRASYYRAGAGMPPLGTPAGLAALGPPEVRGFFAHWYLRGDALVTAVGNTGDATERAARAIAASLPAGSAPQAALAVRPFAVQPKRIVTRRDVHANYIVLGFGAPALGDRDFAAALVMRALLGDIFEVPSATTVPALFRPSGTIYGYDMAPAQFVLWLNGRLVDPGVGLAAVDAVLKNAAVKPLGAAVLARYKESARGAWLLENLSLDERAWSIGNAVAHGLAADASDSVAPAIARVTAADLQRVAKRYFQRFDVALVLPRQGPGG
ncbi:MAG: peptidase [Candidatus Eremiobacteraeota bacterium]|nr:peptidase [Candidatus Eremiobacteraeota bacterium]